MQTRTLRTAAVIATALCAAATETAAGDWKLNVTPYIWATDVGVDASIDDRQLVDTTIPVEDLAEDIDATFQIHLEARRSAHGVLFDIFDVRLSEEGRTVTLPASGDTTLALDSEMSMTIYEVGGIYDPHGNGAGFQLLYGSRILDESAEIDATLAPDPSSPVERSYASGDTLVDALVGARYVKYFGKHFSTSFRADVSAGGTELSTNLNGLMGYSFGKTGSYALTLGFRRLDVDFEDESSVDSSMTLAGPMVGFRMSF